MHEALESLEPATPLPVGLATVPLATALVEALVRLGVREAFGVVGGAVASLARAVAMSPVRFIHCRHESGAAFAATELSLMTGRPAVVLTTTGPGITNAITGLLAARWEGAKVLLISAATSPPQRGRKATQETTLDTLPHGLYAAGGLFHEACLLASPAELEPFCRRMGQRFARPEGCVAHLALPIALQHAPALHTSDVAVSVHLPPPADEALDHVVERLAFGSSAIWLGFGARHAAREVRVLAEALGAPVLTSPRAKGLFSEVHPLWLGVTGVGGHPSAEAWLGRFEPEHVVVLGSRLGESTSFFSQALRPASAFIHVDVDPGAFGAAYPDVSTIGIVSDVATFATRLAQRWGRRAPQRAVVAPPERPRLVPRDDGLVRPQVLMAALQRVVLDSTDLPILAESGNAFAWATNLLRVQQPGRYRVSSGLGAMGHMTTGVLGAALARGGAVAVVGDGAMLMQHEISTAAQYGVHAVWVVLNDAVYNMCDQGMSAMGWSPFHMAFPRVDFVGLATSLGARAFAVDRETELPAVLEQALAAPGPVVVDVRIDPLETAPTVARNRSLIRQAEGPR